MPRTIVFLLHGMGNHPDDTWHEEWVKALRVHYDALTGSSLLNEMSFDDRFEFVPVTYDPFMRQLLQQWHDKGSKLDKGLKEFDDQPDLVDLIRKGLVAAGGDTFFWTHAADTLLYRAVPDVRERIKVMVGRKIIETLKEHAGPNTRKLPPWGVIAHSLGTSVAHDTLDAIWTGFVRDDDFERFEPTQGGARAKLVAMVANVSRILQTKPKALSSTVMPGPNKSKVPDANNSTLWRGCESYINLRHRWDPFVVPKPFDPVPPDWPDHEAVENGLYVDIESKHIHDINVHSFTHYMADPDAHLAIFEKLSHKRAIGEPHKMAARKRFAEISPLQDHLVTLAKDRLMDLDVGEKTPWPLLGKLRAQFEEHVLSVAP